MIDPLTKWILKVGVAAILLIGSGMWIYSKGEAAADARHAATFQRLAELTAKAAQKAHAARAAYGEAVAADLVKFEKEKSDAFQRGKDAAAGIAAGTVQLRTVWRDRECPAAAPRQSPGSDGGDPPVDQRRADAVGRVLGLGWQWDATYGLAVARLRRAQELLNACYEQPAN